MKENEITELLALVQSLKELSLKSEDKVKNLLYEVKSLKEKFEYPNSCPEIRRDWIPRDEVKVYLQFGDTQMSAITKKYGITYTEIGKRKFYSTTSIQKVLENHKKN